MKPAVQLPFGIESYLLGPSKIIALGLNYRDHIAESVTVRSSGQDHEAPDEPVLFPKLASAIVGPDAEIVLPTILGEYQFPDERTDYEGEIAVIIGREGKDIPVASAWDYVMGITAANDVSQRNIQKSDRSGWFRGKSFDTFLPIGPRIVSASQFSDPENIHLETRLNGAVVQSGNSRQMIFPISEAINFVSRNFVLYPGDIILTGTPAGVGPLTHGDVVEVEVDQVGILRNTVRDPRHS
jgi:2-keto-4-pentenoate hydratase/2-oxohepta-3-ene-1,7-dioic acid hydratase in catechol pathway